MLILVHFFVAMLMWQVTLSHQGINVSTWGIMQPAYWVHGFSSWTIKLIEKTQNSQKKNIHTHREALCQPELTCFSVIVSHPLALFPIVAFITALLTRLHAETFPNEKGVCCPSSTSFPFCVGVPKNVASACISLCASTPTHPMAHMYYVSCVYSGKAVDCSAILAALQEAKDLVQAFGKCSSRAPSALSVMNNIFKKLQPQVNKCEVSFMQLKLKYFLIWLKVLTFPMTTLCIWCCM